MKNLTKLFCDLLSAGSQMASAPSVDKVAEHINYLALTRLPDDCYIDIDAIAEHIDNCRCTMKGADSDIDNVRANIAAGKPVNIRRIVEFHNKLTVTMSNGSQLTFNATDIVHY